MHVALTGLIFRQLFVVWNRFFLFSVFVHFGFVVPSSCVSNTRILFLHKKFIYFFFSNFLCSSTRSFYLKVFLNILFFRLRTCRMSLSVFSSMSRLHYLVHALLFKCLCLVHTSVCFLGVLWLKLRLVYCEMYRKFTTSGNENLCLFRCLSISSKTALSKHFAARRIDCWERNGEISDINAFGIHALHSSAASRSHTHYVPVVRIREQFLLHIQSMSLNVVCSSATSQFHT